MRTKRLLAFGELTGILGNLARRGLLPPAAAPLTAFVDDGIDRYDYEAQTLRSPGFLLAPLIAQRFRAACGRDDAHLRAVVARFVALGRCEVLELDPYRRFELEELLAGAGFTPRDEQLLSRTLDAALAPLRKPPSAFSPQDGYALTHIAFSLCDHGAREAEGLVDAPEAIAEVRRLVALGGRMALIERDLDLLAEYVACARFLGGDDGWFVPAACALAVASQAADGSLPTYAAERPAEAEDPQFFARYHATLLWAYAVS